MIKNYFKIAFRNLAKHKGISFINIFGLSVGITCCLLIMLYVKDELGYDRFNKDAGQVYRVVKDFVNDDGTRLPDATTPPALGPAMQKEIPEIESVTRIFPGWSNKFSIKYGDKTFLEEKLYRADSSIFDVFTFTVLRGDPKKALSDRTSIILTASTAKKYFDKEDPIGKTLEIDALGSMMVRGVIKDIPDNAHFHFDFLISNKKFAGNIDEDWGFYNFYTYIKLKNKASIATVDPKIRAVYKKNRPQGTNDFYSQALTSIHLNSQLKWELEANSDKMYIYVFSIIALFVILIACINYVNLTTARSSLRAKEIGIRKVSGAYKTLLIKQFLIESVCTAIISLLLAFLLASLLLPAINQLTQKHIALFSNGNLALVAWSIGFTIFIGLLAGIYPAIYLSSFRPVLVLKGLKLSGAKGFNLRKALVVFQFSISIAMIAGTLIIMQQIRYIRQAKLGLDKNQVLIVEGTGRMPSNVNHEALKNELMEMPAVKKLAGGDGIIGGQNWTNTMRVKGSKNEHLVNFLTVGYDYLDVMGIHIKEGRGFSSKFPSDTSQSGIPGTLERYAGGIILNETAVRQLGVPSPVIGQKIAWGVDNDTTYYMDVVGVVNDFHFTSFRSPIKPFAFVTDPGNESLLVLKLQGKDPASTIASIEKKWNKYSPDRPFQYSFLDQTFSRLYNSEEKFKKVFVYITTLALIIACLGLFGLAAFVTQQRTREIGIRKVFGATMQGLVSLLSKDFLKLVLISTIIAVPASWYFMNKWLEDFAYRVNLGWWVFLVAASLALLIAFITISTHAIRAALANPIKSLRTE